jgi:anti-sigma-K factor RskA
MAALQRMGKLASRGHMIGYRWTMEHSRATDLLEAHALGALDADERHAVERHLATCAECRHLAADLAATADLLPLALAAASSLRPPTDLKDRVLRAARGSAMVVPQPEASTPPSATFAQPLPGLRIVPGRAGRWRAVAAAALLVVLALSLLWGARLSEALDQERALRASVAAHFSRQQEIVLEVVDAAEATRLILRSPDPDSSAYGKLFTRPDLPHVVAMAARLPMPPQGQTYHLWLTSEGRTFLAGVLPVNDQGFGLLTFDADHDGPVYEAARLTLQAAGAEAPGGETVLAWSE